MIKLRNIVKGQIFWECQSGRNARCVALGNAEEEKRKNADIGHYLKVYSNSETTEFFESNNAGGYSLKLYDSPEYVPYAKCMSEEDYELFVLNVNHLDLEG